MKEQGKHDYSGSCAPGKTAFHNNTFSVGIFRWVAKASGNGVKKSAVIVRVSGSTSAPENVYNKAREICAALDIGTYSGPKFVKVKHGNLTRMNASARTSTGNR